MPYENVDSILFRLPAKSRRKIYWILANVSIILLFISIFQIQWVNLEVTDFLGLAAHFTPLYWIGLSLITILSVILYNDKEVRDVGTLLFVLFIVGMFLFGVGVFAEENARAWSSYYPTGEVNTLLEDHNWDISSEYPLISYHSWPAFHFITASILSTSGSPLSDLAKYMPLFWVVLFTLFTFVIGKLLRHDLSLAFATSFLALSSFWQIYYYYSPQSYAYLTALFLILAFTLLKDSSRKYIILTLSFFMLVFSHLLYSVLFFSSLAIQTARKKHICLVAVFSIILLSWYIYISHLALDSGLSKITFMLENTDIGITSQAGKFTPKTTAKLFVDIFRFSYAGIFALLIGITAVNYLRGKIDPETKQKIQYWMYWIIPFIAFTAVDYGSEGFERVYLFCIVPLVCIIVLFFTNKKFITLLLIIFIVLHVPAHYGTDAFFATYTSELEGSSFFASKIDISPPEEISKVKFIYDSGGERYLWYYDPSLILADKVSDKFIRTREDASFISNIDYIITGKHEQNFKEYYGVSHNNYRAIEYAIEKDTFNLVYSNGGLSIYPKRGSP